MMPVGYYRKRRHWLDRGVHIDPDCALDIYERLGAKNLIPVHWGTLHLFPARQAPRKRLAAIAGERGAKNVTILWHREKLTL
jgi:L-ascorbate metabolism protein UlaG (beta-lactamase superfamily)